MKKVTITDMAKEPTAMPGGLMTGTQVYTQRIFQPGDSNNFGFGIVHFDSGSRNKFHKHSGDQILVITEGTGKVATDSEVVTVTQGEPLARGAGQHVHGPHRHTCRRQ